MPSISVSQTCCYQEHWLHSLIHEDERCWINSKLYLLFSLLLLVKLLSTLLTSCQKLCRMSSPWKSKYRLQRLDYYFFFFLGSEKWLQITVFRMMIFLTYSILFQVLPLLSIPVKNKRSEKNSEVSLALASRAPWGPRWGGCPLTAHEKRWPLRIRDSWVFSFLVCERGGTGPSLNVWSLLSPERALNTDLSSFLSCKLLQSPNFVQLSLFSGWKRILWSYQCLGSFI